ncbi:hypothetical protein Pyn_20153 [Prunus yedoensis var. nudiflora]|uniref:Uncharacterized protein n=1 Tax=Prunus yedoensis var. nudiflora TaxID=2094558 RepID=A0A314XLS9_PRUYE|nr:hypothetical protein Pyn_20153 [Prunus yedoensis var. nudiflora]
MARVNECRSPPAEEARKMSGEDDVVFVFRSGKKQLHTTRSGYDWLANTLQWLQPRRVDMQLAMIGNRSFIKKLNS